MVLAFVAISVLLVAFGGFLAAADAALSVLSRGDLGELAERSRARRSLQAIAAVLLSDFCTYWGHRLAHRLPFLWRFHKVHHTAVKLDWLAVFI